MKRFSPALLGHAEALLSQLLRFDAPADSIVSRYFREHRQMGGSDRAFVAETVYAVLRRLYCVALERSVHRARARRHLRIFAHPPLAPGAVDESEDALVRESVERPLHELLMVLDMQ